MGSNWTNNNQDTTLALSLRACACVSVAVRKTDASQPMCAGMNVSLYAGKDFIVHRWRGSDG